MKRKFTKSCKLSSHSAYYLFQRKRNTICLLLITIPIKEINNKTSPQN